MNKEHEITFPMQANKINQPEGLEHKEYKHGDNPVKPASSRADRLSSFAVEDFPIPSGREEEWRFTPLPRFSKLLALDSQNTYTEKIEGWQISIAGQPLTADGTYQFADQQVEVNYQQESFVTEGSSKPSLRGQIGAPGDRLAVLAYAHTVSSLELKTKENAQLDQPIVVDLIGNNENAQAAHVGVEIAPNSHLALVMNHRGTAHLNQNVEIKVGADAELTLVTVQEWESDSTHAANHRIYLDKGAHIKHMVVSFGGDAVRICSDVELGAEGSRCDMLGLYFTDAGQHQEHRVFVDHNAPHAVSRVTYKGALQGKQAHSVWIGDVLIRANATGTDSYELNRNLVLTKEALADSVPNLEIETGQIEGAGHASATGRFDDEQLFYLMSRGIPKAEARRLVVLGFFKELVAAIELPSVEAHLMEIIERELEASA